MHGLLNRLQSKAPAKPQMPKDESPPSITMQLKNWEKERRKRRVTRLLKSEMMDVRILIPMIIFQPGKVGSTSVHMSLIKKYQELGVATPVFHAHILENVDQRIELLKVIRAKPDNSIDKLLESKELRQQIDKFPKRRWNVISLVRDPVALRVSAFFQLLDEYLPDWQPQIESGKITLLDLQNLFYEKGGLGMDGLNTWFDAQIKPIWGIDVYNTPFSKDRGYHIYKQNPNVNLMIIRLEDLNTVAQDAFYEFLGIKDFTIIRENIGAKKPYSDLYKHFKTLPLPRDIVNEAYDSRYARHFYTDREIEKFRRKWQLEK